MGTAAIALELARRDDLWRLLLQLAPNRDATPAILATAGIRPAKTGQGIFRDQRNTEHLAPAGVTLTVLETGTTYADAFDNDAGEYHYPTTNRGGLRDANEVEATKNAGRLGLPVFVILKGATSGTREVRRGWIESWDDARRVFLIAFGNSRPPKIPSQPTPLPFALTTGPRVRRSIAVASRPGQARFRYHVLSRCGGACVLCGLRVDLLLEAAHLCSVEDAGTDDPRNGLAMCRNHHRAFDAVPALFGVEPDTLRIVAGVGLSVEELGITNTRLNTDQAPHVDALRWAWDRFQRDR
jgi:putative restriction endonuclease